MSPENKIPEDILRKSESRLAVVKALYSNYANDEKKNPAELALDIISYYDEGNDELQGAQIDAKFLTALLQGIGETHEELEDIVTPHLSEAWSLERMGPVLRGILQAAVYELTYRPEIPFKVIINEYVDITRAFFDAKEVGFVNGILDKIAAEVREK